MYFRLEAFPFETKRLYIRLIDLSDLKGMFRICSNKNVTKYLTFQPHQSPLETQRIIMNMQQAYLAKKCINYAIFLKENREMIGSCSLTFTNDYQGVEIGYLLDENYWNHGYMTELMPKLIEISFHAYHVEAIYAKHILENEASKRIIEKNHFQLIGVDHSFIKDETKFTILNYILTKQVYTFYALK